MLYFYISFKFLEIIALYFDPFSAPFLHNYSNSIFLLSSYLYLILSSEKFYNSA